MGVAGHITTIDATRPAPSGWRAMALLARLMAAFATRARRRAAQRALYSIDERLLADIGIARDQIPALVEDLLRGKGPHPGRAATPPPGGVGRGSRLTRTPA